MKVAIASANRVLAEALRRAVVEDPGDDVAWTAKDGTDALRRCRDDVPDLLLVDVEIATPDVVEVTRAVTRDGQGAVLVVSRTRDSHVSRVFEAMGAGALDAVAAPDLDADGELTGARALRERLALARKLVGKRPEAVRLPAIADAPDAAAPLVAIGASTGGPQALAVILEKLPRDLPASLVIVQHIEEDFAAGLQSWLAERSGFEVALALAGDPPRRSAALVAATRDHLVLGADRRVAYRAEPRDAVHRPSVDVFFGSLLPYSPPGIAVLLTGMGRDGADGLLRLRRAGWTTISQDARTSVVYGMPKAAAEIGAAQHVVPLEAIAPTIVTHVNRLVRHADDGVQPSPGVR